MKLHDKQINVGDTLFYLGYQPVTVKAIDDNYVTLQIETTGNAAGEPQNYVTVVRASSDLKKLYVWDRNA